MAKALFILFKDYSQTHDGGSQANMRSLRLSRQILGEENVDCYYVHDIHRHRSLLSRFRATWLFSMGYFNGLTPKKVQKIIRRSAGYDYVFITNSIFGLVAKALKQAGYQGRILSFFHNVESIYYESRVPKRLPLRKLIIDCAARNDRYALRYSDTVIGLCERDSQILKRLYGKGFDVLAPISFADKCKNHHFDTEALTHSRPRCMFIGSNFPANANGVLWFVREVLPHVDIDFTIVGQDMDKLQSGNPCLQGIAVHSDVPDLTPYWEQADFMIFPIFDGSGMKVKTCEALMYGKNILGTTESFEGYDIDPNQCGRLCNTAEEYITALQEFTQRPIHRYNPYTRNCFLQHYSESSTVHIFKQIYHL